MEKEAKFIMITADDYGISPAVNDGIQRLVEAGAVTNVSLMPFGKFARNIRELTGNEVIAIGLHLDFTWVGNGILDLASIPLRPRRRLRYEFERQVGEFEEKTGRRPDYIDGHRHAQAIWPLNTMAKKYATEHGISIRGHDAPFSLQFHGRTIRHGGLGRGTDLETMVKIYRNTSGVLEIVTHPATMVDYELINSGTNYLQGRVEEFNTLINPSTQMYLRQVFPEATLGSWNDLRRRQR